MPAVIPRVSDTAHRNPVAGGTQNFEAGADDEVSFTKGQRMVLLSKPSPDWWIVRSGVTKQGLAPSSLLADVEQSHWTES